MTKLPSSKAETTRTSVVPLGSKAKTNASRIGLLPGLLSVPRMARGMTPPEKPRTWKSAVATPPSVTATVRPVDRETPPSGKNPSAVPPGSWARSAWT